MNKLEDIVKTFQAIPALEPDRQLGKGESEQPLNLLMETYESRNLDLSNI